MEFLYSKVWVLLNIVNALFVFLTIFNGSSRGNWKAHMDAFCGGAVIICLILMLIFTGWKGVLAGFVFSFIFGAIAINPANKLRELIRKR